MQKFIRVNGARENNLRNVSLEIPRDRFVVFTGVSGSGKSSLAFDTLHAEGQMRYVESMSSYARMFLGNANKPDVDSIEGLSPAIAIEQKTTSSNPRSTVGTVTEIYDYLRLLWARIGVPHCPTCKREISRQSVDQILDQLGEWPEGTRYLLLAPLVRDRKGEHRQLLEQAKLNGYVRIRVNGELMNLTDEITLEKNKRHTIEIVVDRLTVKTDKAYSQRLTDSLENAFALSGDMAIVHRMDTGEDVLFSQSFACPQCGFSLPELSPSMFSFNNQAGACRTCTGLGFHQKFDPRKIMPDRTRSLKSGAIVASGWGNVQESSYARAFFEALALAYGFKLDTPLSGLSDEIIDILLYGTRGAELEIKRTPSNRSASKVTKQAFEGIITNLERRYRETGSEGVRKELESSMSEQECPDCRGERLNPAMLAVTVDGMSLSAFCRLTIQEAREKIRNLDIQGAKAIIGESVIRETVSRLDFMQNVGLEYLTLSRSAGTLSGGEGQRIRLATQIGSGLTGVLYIMDEPSIGLHQRDNERLLGALRNLCELGNTLIVVEHDEDTIRQADWIVDVGPGAGSYGGEIVAQGLLEQIMNEPRSVTGQYLSRQRQIPVPEQRRIGNGKRLSVLGAAAHNLKNIDVSIPLGTLTCVTGVSGSGKSSLVNGIIYNELAAKLNRAHTRAGAHRQIEGIEHLDKVIYMDQKPIGRTPRSNPVTYTGVFENIRALFAMTNEAKVRAYTANRFSFNVKGGRCEACAGDGLMRIEMHFLPDVFVPCDICKGKRYNRETLEVHYKGKSIADVLDMTADEAVVFFEHVPKIRKKIEAFCRAGLGYIKLGQSSTTLSGGEAQRVKLAAELQKPATGSTLYIMDEPTTGLHIADVHLLIDVLHTLTDAGNTVVVIEHNLDLIKNADYLIDLGPGGGAAGGTLICEGTPEQVAACASSDTGAFLARELQAYSATV